jgi:hypothetical protein
LWCVLWCVLALMPVGASDERSIAHPRPARVTTPHRPRAAARDPALLRQALTHVSVLGAPNYQRLEFLGDALIDLVVSLRLMACGHATA